MVEQITPDKQIRVRKGFARLTQQKVQVTTHHFRLRFLKILFAEVFIGIDGIEIIAYRTFAFGLADSRDCRLDINIPEIQDSLTVQRGHLSQK